MPNLQLSQNLLTLRKANHLTQDQVRVYLNVSRQAYSNYEIGTRMPDLDTLLRLSQFYHVTLDELITHNLSNTFSEQHGPYNIALNISTADTLYLTDEEVQVILKYRNLDLDNRSILKGFLDARTTL